MKWRLFVFFLLAANGAAWYQVIQQSRIAMPAFYFFDVGQGDSELIQLGDVQFLIDGGPPNGKALAGLERGLAPHDRYIDLVLLTHSHLDHFGGLIDIIQRYRVGKFITGGGAGTAPALKNLPQPNIILGEGDRIRYGGYALTFLGPSPQERASDDPNITSLVILLEGPNIKILYTGDIGADQEERVRKKYKLTADVLKVGHHGSRFSSETKFVKEVRPKIAIIEVGKNSYNHPHPNAVSRLEQTGALIYATIDHGTIKIISDKEKIRIFTKYLPVPSPKATRK